MSIAVATARCLRTMTACLEIEKLMKAAWAENRLADFKLWIAGIGALAPSRLSLDTRLNLKPEAREVITNLLNLLAITVDECQKIANRAASESSLEDDDEEDLSELLGALSSSEIPARPFSPWSDDDSTSDEQSSEEFEQSLSISKPLHQSMQDVEMLLDQLAQIAIAVRRSGTRSRLHRADWQFKLEEHGDLQAHLTAILILNKEKDHSELNTRADNFDSSNLSEIQKRLIRCNLKRRNRFLYAQRHSKSLGLVTAAAQTRPPEEVSAVETLKTTGSKNDVKTESQRSSSNAPEAAVEEAKVPTNPTVATGTKASAVSDSFALPQPTLPSPAASTILSSTAVSLKYPRPPKIADGANTFTCPCCCQIFPRVFSEGNKWKKHIAHDLCPYTCILSGCATPEVLYTTKNDWRQHLLDRHLGFEYWICFTCEGTEQFRSEEEFIHHNKLDHEASINPGEMSLLVEICRRVAPVEISFCPLCDWPKDEEGEVDKNVLLDHIAKDLHSFSLRSLPWDDDNGQESEERIIHSSEKVSKWLIDNELQKDYSIKRPPLEEKVHAFDYFRHNLYFAANSISSNSSEYDSTTSIQKELKNLKDIERSVTFGSHASGEVDVGDELPLITKPTGDQPLLKLIKEQKKLQKIANLLDYGQITEKDREPLTAIFGKDTMALLLDQPEDQITITKEVVKALARNDEYGQEVMALFLNAQGQIVLADDAVSSVAEEFDEKVMAMLFDRLGGQIIITDEILEAAARNKLRSKEVTAFLLEQGGESDSAPMKGFCSLSDLDINTLASRHKKIGSDWCVVFNPQVNRVLDIDLFGSLDYLAPVTCVQFSHDGKYLATGCGGFVQIFDIKTGKKVCVLAHDDRKSVNDSIVHSVGFSPDGLRLATAENEYVRVWDIATKTIRNQFSGGEDYVMTLVYGLDGRTIAFDCNNTVQIWDIEQNKNTSILHLQDSVQAVAISDDIQFVAAGSTNGSISLWSVVTGSLITTLEGPDGHNEPICSMNFSSNTHGLVSSSFDGTIKMWDLQGIHSGKEGNEYIRTLETGHTSPVYSVTLTPDARFVLSGSDDSRVQFWDAENGKAQLMLRGHSQAIHSVASSPQGGYFATGSGDRTARIWSYSPYETHTERSV